MKKAILMSFPGFFIAALLFTATAVAAEFSADIISEQMGQRTKSKVYVKGDNMRMEATGPEGELSISIMDIKKGTMYVLMPEEKVYMEMSGFMAESQMDQFKAEEEIAKVADKKHIGVGTIDGYLCDKYEFIYHDTSLGKMTQWQSKKLGYPIKMIYHSPYGDMVTEYKNIREGGVSSSLFEIPAGYQKMPMPGAGSWQ